MRFRDGTVVCDSCERTEDEAYCMAFIKGDYDKSADRYVANDCCYDCSDSVEYEEEDEDEDEDELDPGTTCWCGGEMFWWRGWWRCGGCNKAVNPAGLVVYLKRNKAPRPSVIVRKRTLARGLE